MKEKISLKKLKGVPETLLLPLRGRYLETRRAGGFINDPKSVEIIDSIDHDFATSDLPWDGQMVISTRTEILDEATTKFLNENPDSVVVNLGCGLDTRITRVDNGRVSWYDLDLPECIELRKNFFTQTDRSKFVTEWHYLDRHPMRWKWMTFFRFVPPLHKIMKIVHLQFPAQAA